MCNDGLGSILLMILHSEFNGNSLIQSMEILFCFSPIPGNQGPPLLTWINFNPYMDK